jgi:heterotetrameric sarcosine oxidase gamma subunit
MDNMVSPFDGILIPGRYGREADADDMDTLRISHRMCTGLVQITTWPKTALAVETSIEKITKLKLSDGNNSPSNDDYAIMPTGPGRYLIEVNKPGAEDLFRNKITSAKGAVTNLDHGRVVIRVTGTKATWVLTKGIAIDFSLEAFPVQTSRNTSHHDIGLTIRRVDENSFDLFVFTSLARSFWHWLDIAASETGYEIVQ